MNFASEALSDVARRLSGDDDEKDPYAVLKGDIFGVMPPKAFPRRCRPEHRLARAPTL